MVNTINYMGLERELWFNVFSSRFDKNKCVEWENGKEVEGFKYMLRKKRKPIKDIDKYRRTHAEYARNYRQRQKEKGAN